MEQLQKVNSEKDISSAQALAELLKELARGEKSAEKQGYIILCKRRKSALQPSCGKLNSIKSANKSIVKHHGAFFCWQKGNKP